MTGAAPEPDLAELHAQARMRLAELRSSQPGARIAEARRLIARERGFESWRKLVDELETPALVERMKSLVEAGDTRGLERLLRARAVVRKHLNGPIFSFDSPSIIRAGNHVRGQELLPVLIRYGADPNARSQWWAGSFGPLDNAREDMVEPLLANGTRFDVWSAARWGRAEILGELLDREPGLIDAPGGDGMRPIHFASTVETAQLLIQRGADLELKDVDHEGTPVQHQVNNAAVARLLVDCGARPDVFTAAALDDPEILARVLREDPDAANSQVGAGRFRTLESNGGHIYLYKLGGGKSPQQLAAERRSFRVLEALLEGATPGTRLITAAWLEDPARVSAVLDEDPDAGKRLDPREARALADAAGEGRAETIRLLLEAGVDPMSRGLDTGTALHTACWFGRLAVVRLLIDRVPLDLPDPEHGSPPLGWALHGAMWCRAGDYPEVVEALLEAGADLDRPANRGGTSMLAQAGDREDVKEVLRRYGAV